MARDVWPALIFVCLTGLTVAAHAQNYGEIAGTLSDPSGLPIPGATVTITNESTGAVREASTNATGRYTVPFINPGRYTVAAEQDGFRTARTPGLLVEIGDVKQLSFALELGVFTEVVEVDAGAQMLASATTSVGTVIDNQRIVDLPINGRNFLSLVKLSPNVTAEMPAGGQANGRQGGERANQSISIAGQRQQFNRYTLDGVENTDPNFNTFVIRPSIDALQEFKVQTGVYSAEWGKSTSQVIVTTKSGTNEFHGTVYEFFRHNKIQARTWGRHGEKDPFQRNQFGFTTTGPIVRNQLFFMANYEGLRETVPVFKQARVADQAMRNGDFSASYHNQIFDPTGTRETAPGQYAADPFPNNIIPVARLDPVSVKLLEFYPLPNVPGVDVNTTQRNFNRNGPRLVGWDQFTTRVDWAESAGSQWFGRYSWGGETVSNGETFEFQDKFITTDVQQIMLANTRTFSPTLINELRLGVSLFDNDLKSYFNGVRDVTSELDILGLPIPPELAWGTPRVVIRGGANSFNDWGEGTAGPFINRNRNYQIVNNTSWIRGNHTIKFGVDVSEARYAQSGNEVARGQFLAHNAQTAHPNEAGTGEGFASFMTGFLSEATRVGGFPNVQFRRNPVMLYAEDVWRASNKLTFNLGLRYESTPPWHDKHAGFMNVLFHGCLGVDDTGIDEDCPVPTLVRPGKASDFHEGLTYHFADSVPKAVSDDLLFSRSLVRRDTNDFAPRIGISYAPDAKTTIRTGYGWFYAQDTANPVFDMARNLGARETNRSDVTFDGPWENTAAGPATCSGWDGTCVSGVQGFANDAGRVTPNIQQWVLNIQRQFTDSTMLEVGYMGSVGHNLQKMHGWNQPLLRAGPDDMSDEVSRRPWGLDAYGLIQTISSLGNSNYNALGVKLVQRNSRGLTYLIGYTWAKSIDDSSAIRVNGGDNLFPYSPYDFTTERGLSQFHTNHRLTASILYQLPVSFESRVLESIAGGWQVGSILTFSTGTPRNHAFPRAGLNCNESGAGGPPDATGVDPHSGPGTAEEFWAKDPDTGLSASYYCPAGDALEYRYGNSTRNDLIGPGYKNIDFSLAKTFAITETMGVEFKFESFNFTNHPNWNVPLQGFRWDSKDFGVITSARDMRTNQFALKFNF